MGLDLSVGDKHVAQWAYSGFMLVPGVVNHKDMASLMKEVEDKYVEGGHISWDTIDDPIKLLLHHSDCDGILTPKQCAQVAPRLAELIKDWPDKITFETQPAHQKLGYPEVMTIDDHDTVNAKSLVEGMLEAARTNTPLRFH